MARRKPKHPRSHRWPAVRRRFLAGKTCAVCDGTANLEAHHVHPVHLFPERELVESNLIALCEAPGHNCHLIFGHLGSWHSFNASVRWDAKQWSRKIKRRPKGKAKVT